jgi:hypothetical protein
MARTRFRNPNRDDRHLERFAANTEAVAQKTVRRESELAGSIITYDRARKSIVGWFPVAEAGNPSKRLP